MIVIDANIILAAIRSIHGASHELLRQMVAGRVAFAISPAVVLEYEDVLKRPGILGGASWIGRDEIDVVLDTLVTKATLVSPFFRFRPFLGDPKDDLYIECALAAGADTIITNDRHFADPLVEAFGLSVRNVGSYVAEMSGRR
jgi:putative PIN family toxin of toxin-antitoxin system